MHACEIKIKNSFIFEVFICVLVEKDIKRSSWMEVPSVQGW